MGWRVPWREPSQTLVDLDSKPLCKDGYGGIGHLATTPAVCQARRQEVQTLHLGAMSARRCFPPCLPRASAPAGDGQGSGAVETWSVKGPADSSHFEGPDGEAPETVWGPPREEGAVPAQGLRGEPKHLLFPRKVLMSLHCRPHCVVPAEQTGAMFRRGLSVKRSIYQGAFVSGKKKRRGVLSRERFPVSGEH